MFGFIKNLIAGILGFVTGLLPGKKQGKGYFLELDEAKSIKPLETVKKAASNTQKAVETVISDSKKEVETVPSKAPASSNGTKPAASIADSKSVKASKNGKVPKAEPKPELTPAASKVAKIPTETTFAPKYLAPSATSSNGRRRPGANMTSFLEMARNVKTPG
ncbi:MAG: hypothetical protein KME54_14560 [Tolypothrix brevis GSE-NOS-MK-07-07A]|jgi:hypothetical protein|nr:hypothetical protein [Tolypothrix brevis GSE-NOS-MK-07-07A]